MDYQVTLLEPALLDLESQVIYKAQESDEKALEHSGRIFTAASTLKNHPHRGKLIPWLGLNYRELVLKPDYHLVYQVDDEALTVEICAVIHCSQDFRNAWLSRERT